ncbi:MAG: hypothetical protein Q9170_002118 [Blastenia crenularia]
MALYTGALSLSKDPHPEFRILLLSAGESLDELHGELIKASIDDVNIPYTALSYTWGDPSNPGSIVLNAGHRLPITRNLEAALRQLRSTTGPLHIWVDAICICQSNSEEKSFQVGMMRSIYLSASQTWVWLGPSSSDSDNAMDIVQEFHNRDLSSDELRLVGRGVWDGIGNLMRRTYWTRVWVIQEVLSSRRVYVWCGCRQVDFECFVKLEEIRRDFAFRHIPTQPFATLLSNWSLNLQIVRGGRAPLFEWMADTHKFEFTLPRDRIYALLGLSSEDSRRAIVPDYSSRTSDTLLAVQATAHYLMQQKRLLPLQSGFYKKADGLNLPSWVSDWSTSQAGYVPLVFESAYNACGQYTTSTPRFLPPVDHPSSCLENTSLILKGVIEGEIQTAIPMPEVPLYNGTDTDADLESRRLRREVTRSTCRTWKELDDRESDNNQPGVRNMRYEAFWRTVIADRLLDGTGPPGPEYGRYFQDWQAAIDSDGATNFRNAAVSHCAGRSFIRSRDGRLGLAPKSTRVGDIVCLFHGGDVPFILRPFDSGRYGFVGEAYIHGVMQGEHAGKLGGANLRDFEIL